MVQNSSFLMKLAYHLVSNTDALWTRVLKAKYKFDSTYHRTNYSFVWRSLARVWPLLKEFILVGWEWESITASTDCWISERGALIEGVPSLMCILWHV